MAIAICIASIRNPIWGANGKWFILCITALLFNTISIILTTVPSQYNMQDAMGLRGVSIMGFMALLYYAIKRYKHIKTDILAIKIAIVNSAIIAMVQILTYPLLDALAAENMAYIFTPIKLISQILFFSLITTIKFKEKLSKIQLTGMIMCVAGILLFLV